ncbi:queuosine salvage protein isoform X1 [Nasonia vitripennis]|uniref:Queuosine 5'-phosphate N-glycosylase/hydrolase n=1 Tax=Nasonia vitripennis TaxID=7425 RepID=A0A7M7TAE3_NASVI|nr:queuosine salvage protein isoform X1 [Nasonia vitripennis]XP_031786920.1 queuosine salvage protein isoform X1 [Nasonia vitripennis]XP_031786922.1 queuosine salvage protein isoform X1 [Nasonia vitripennis]
MSSAEVLMPRESGKFIAETAKDVFIEAKGVEHLAHEIVKNLKSGALSPKNFSQHVHHPTTNDLKAVDWLFVIDTLNFCFWTDSEVNKRWKVEGQSGYFALCAAVKRALDAGIPLTDATFLSKITADDVRSILRADADAAEVPLIDERVKNLNEVGRVLLEKYNGTFIECLKVCDKSAENLLKLVVTEFECYRDEADYRNKRVSFYKRAQILVGDIWACFEGKGHGEFHDIEYITMFADYRVPQVLVHYGAMRYSEALLAKLSTGTEVALLRTSASYNTKRSIPGEHLQAGCIEETEIRGCSIEAVERVVEQVRKLVRADASLNLKEADCNSILVDHFLWDYRRKHVEELEHIPFHKVRTIFY